MDYEYFIECLRCYKKAVNCSDDDQCDSEPESLDKIIRLIDKSNVDEWIVGSNKENEIIIDLKKLKQSVNSMDFIDNLHNFYKKIFEEPLIETETRNRGLDNFISGLLIGSPDIRLSNYIEIFLSRLPDDAFDFFLYESLFLVIQIQANTVDKYIIQKGLNEIKFIIFVSDLCNSPEDEIIYTIAHEFAHLYLGHEGVGGMTHDDSKEIDADNQVVKWGFEKELRSSSWSYLYGEKLSE